jgi:demethylmenaquinone methyltransferase/2-methoxy-6-polyprenyl-1,4-benzoquinol methylase
MPTGGKFFAIMVISMNDSIRRVYRTKSEAQASYDRLSRWYDLLSGSSEARPRQAGLELLHALPGEQVLDIGPGTGHSLAALARAVGKTGCVQALDLSPGMLAVSRARLAKASDDAAVCLTCGDALRLPYPAGAFDAVFSSFNLELFDTPEIPQVLEECRRVLRPGGRISVVSLSKASKSQAMIKLYEWSHDRFPAFVDCRPIYVQPALEQASFHIQAVKCMLMWGLPVEIVLAQK